MSEIIDALYRDTRRDSLALIGRYGALTYSTLGNEVEALAQSLKSLQVARLALYADNTAAWVVIDLACLRAGIPLVPLPTFFSAEQVAHTIKAAAVDYLLAPEVGRTLAGERNETRASWRIANERFDCIYIAPSHAPDRDDAKITFTSGTTGQPRGVRLRASVQEAVAVSLQNRLAPLALRRHLAVLPLATLLENVAGVYVPLLLGAIVHLAPLDELGYSGASGLNVSSLIGAIRRIRPESMILVPALLQALVDAVEHGAALPDSLRFIAVGGGRVAVSLIERARAAGLPVYEGYGLSECASVVSLNLPGSDCPGSAGRPLPHARVQIAPDGEILVHGPHYSGYLGSIDVPEETPIATGDIGHVDAEGFLHITGRKKDIFITAFGRNVSPEWIEAELIAEPAIAQAAVFGEAQPHNIAVLVSAASDAAIDDAVRRTNSRLPDYARVARWLRAAAPFTAANNQLTPNGRVRRAAVWNMHQHAILKLYLEG